MKINKLIKYLNNTELGKGTTHEYYILVTADFDVNDIFSSFVNDESNFIDRIDGSIIPNIRLHSGGETRIVGLGPYFRKYDLNAGDGICFERIEENNIVTFYLSYFKKDNNIIFQKVGSKGFELLYCPPSINFPINKQCIFNNQESILNITLSGRARKRSDSPDETDFYSINLGNIDIFGDVRNKELIEIKYSQNLCELGKIKSWIKYNVEW